MALYVVETIHTFCLMNDKICWKLIPQSLLYTPARNRKYLNIEHIVIFLKFSYENPLPFL